MRRRFILVPAVVLALGVPALAAEPPAEAAAAEPAYQVPAIIVSATRIASTLAASPDAITVISREEIEQLPSRSLIDVLQTVPGLTVSRTGQPGGQATVFMRGANGGQTLVLVDGVRANSVYDGRFNFADLPVDNIERLEIVRGPQSTRYGSDALGGVINIVTKRGAAQPAATALVELGGRASLRTRGSVAASLGGFGLSVEGGSFDTDNARPNNEFHQAGGSLGASWRASERFDVALQGAYRSSRAGAPGDRFTNDPNDLVRTENTAVALTLHGTPAAWWDARLTLARARELLRFEQPEPNPSPYATGAGKTRTVGDSDHAELQNVFTIAPGHQILLALSRDDTPTKYTEISSYGPATIDRSITASAVSGQYDFSPAPSFTASLGARVDDFSTFGTHATWRGGARYTVHGSGTILRANAGTGFRSPTILDLFYPGYSNPDLKPEESLGWDAGVEQPLLAGRLQAGATWFRNDFDNLIAYSATAYRPENIAAARTEGLEVFLLWLPAANVSVNGSYTWLAVAEDRDSGERLLRRPEHSGSLAVHYSFPRWVQLDTSALIAGESADKNFTIVPAESVRNAGYLKWDFGVTVTPWPQLSLVARLENLLDEEYEEAYGFPALGRTFWGGAMVRF